VSTEPQALAQAFKPTVWHRLGFGHAHVAPWDESDDAKYMVTTVTIQFDWLDRLRLLLTGRTQVFTRSLTEHDAGRVESRSAVGVLGPRW
jgi:hypothetical protein